ncbi:MAG: DUF58 domain-containing protein [Anaerolineae bacterium]|nr:DUF58 domain-containing protein [Anaerolineae bacterium]
MTDRVHQSTNLPDPLFDEPFLRKLERLAIVSRRAMAGQIQGERRSPKRGQSVEFADFRPYAPGDDIRRIDWNAYARLERFFLKLFVDEEDLTIHLLVDASRSMDWGDPNKLHYALRTAGALGYIALAGLDRATATALGMDDGKNGRWEGGTKAGIGYLAPVRGKRQAFTLFQFLSSVLPAGTVHLDAALTRYAARSHHPGPLILLSDLFQPTFQPSNPPTFHSPALTTLASRGFEVTILHILAPDEIDPARAGWLGDGPATDLRLLDAETGAAVEVTADYDLLQRYREGLAAWQEAIRRFCGARGIQYVPVDTSLPIEDLLFAWLRQRGVLG